MVPGPLPKSGTMTKSSASSKLLFQASGSAFNAGGATMIVDVRVNGLTVGQLRAYSNEGSSHKTLVSNSMVVTGLAAGNHSVSLVAAAGTSTDLNDYFDVTAIEFN
jgi:hypothetical protein